MSNLLFPAEVYAPSVAHLCSHTVRVTIATARWFSFRTKHHNFCRLSSNHKSFVMGCTCELWNLFHEKLLSSSPWKFCASKIKHRSVTSQNSRASELHRPLEMYIQVIVAVITLRVGLNTSNNIVFCRHILMHCVILLLEPIEKMTEVEDNKIIESISIPDGIMQSTVDDIMEVTRSVSPSQAEHGLSSLCESFFWCSRATSLPSCLE